MAKILTHNELRDSLCSSNSKIKYYSFLAITEKGENVFDALKVLIDDTTKIKAQHFCMIYETNLADLCISKVTDKDIPLKKRYGCEIYQLTNKEKMELNNLIKNRKIEIK